MQTLGAIAQKASPQNLPVSYEVNVPPMLWDDTPRTRRTDPDTSHEAADSTQSKVMASQREVLHILSTWGALADYEIAAYHLRLGTEYSPSRLRSARSELVGQGLVAFTGRYLLTSSHRRARVWSLTISGLEAVSS